VADWLTALTLVQPGADYMLSIYMVRRVLYRGRSRYQEIAVVELEGFGRTLLLDNLIQSTELDEHIYHESLVQPAMVTHPSPKRVLVLGGGEGATLREVLKHSTVEEAVMVDIDEQVIEVCKKYLPEWSSGAFDDPRTRLVIADGAKYVREASRRGEEFDVVVMDLTDPFGSEIAKHLYSKEFMEEIASILRDDGLMVTQAGCSYVYPKEYMMAYRAVEAVYPIVAEYASLIPSFAYANNFIIGSKKYDPRRLSEEEVEERLRQRNVKTRFYNGSVHTAFFKMPVLKLEPLHGNP